MTNQPSTVANIGPTGIIGPEAGDLVFATRAEFEAAGSIPPSSTVYIAETDARYEFRSDPGLSSDGWAVLDGGASGHFVTVSERLSIAPGEDGSDDWPRMIDAAKATASAGIVLELRAGEWNAASQQTLPDGLRLVMNEDVTIVSRLQTDHSKPSVAAFYATPGSLELSTSVAGSNEFGSQQITIQADVSVGSLLRIRDTETGSGFHGNTFTVTSSVAQDDGTWLVTVDRPIQYDFGPGDAADVLPLMPTIQIFGNGATVTGSGTRFIELIAVRDSLVDGLRLIATEQLPDLMASFDVGGYNNEFRNMFVDAEGHAIVGLALESQEGSRVVNSTVTGAKNGGIIVYDNVDALILDTIAYGNVNGLGIMADGNILGSLNTTVRGGQYYNNGNLGIGVHSGSRGTLIEGVTAYGNADNLRIGDVPSAVSGTRVEGGSFGGATRASISVIGTASGTELTSVDITTSPLGLDVFEGADVIVDGMPLPDFGATNVVGGTALVDRLRGGEGNDLLAGFAGADELFGGGGNDMTSYAGNFGAVWVDLAAGTGTWNWAHGDKLTGIENVVGTGYGDWLYGSSSINKLYGEGGNDRLSGGAGADLLDGGAGEDIADYTGNFGAVWIDLAAGTGTWNWAHGDVLTGIENVRGTIWGDWLYGSSGANKLYGEAGNDRLSGAAGADLLDGGAGEDVADYTGNFGAVWIDLAAGTGQWNWAHGDTLTGIENVHGTSWDDWLYGSSGTNKLYGEDGNDRLSGGAGADLLDGGLGEDTADYTGNFGAVWIDLAAGTGQWNWAHGDTLAGIENVVGTSYDDWLYGSSADNGLSGGAGDDRFIGGAGNDHIDGGAGSDVVILSGLKDDYQIEDIAGMARVTDMRTGVDGNDGQDWLTGIETIRFNDGTEISLSGAGVTGTSFEAAMARGAEGPSNPILLAMTQDMAAFGAIDGRGRHHGPDALRLASHPHTYDFQG